MKWDRMTDGYSANEVYIRRLSTRGPWRLYVNPDRTGRGDFPTLKEAKAEAERIAKDCCGEEEAEADVADAK